MSGSIPSAGGGEPELDVLAGEYVLGVLSAEEMHVVRRQARGDKVLADAIRRWEADLLPLAAALPPVAPPEALWQRIAAATAPLPLDAANDDAMAADLAATRPPRRAVPRPATATATATAASAPRRVWPWQMATAAALALAAGFAAVAFLPQSGPGAAQSGGRIAMIGPVGAPPPAFLANANTGGRVVLTALSPASVPAGHDLELWVLAPGAQKVASLGVLPAGGRSVALPSMPATGTQLLVSLEPTGGSPTGQPTGPVLYAGTLAAQ